jgi:hypothetical protein
VEHLDEEKCRDLRKAIYKAMEGCSSGEAVKMWTAIEINIPTEWFPNGYSSATIDEATRLLEKGPFDRDGLHTNPILMRMASVWQGLDDRRHPHVPSEAELTRQINLDRIRGVDCGASEFLQPGDVHLGMPIAWFDPEGLPTGIADWLEAKDCHTRRYSGARYVHHVTLPFYLEVYYIRPKEDDDRTRNALEATAFKMQMRLMSGNLLTAMHDRIEVCSPDGRICLVVFHRVTRETGAAFWQQTHALRMSNLGDPDVCPTSLAAAVEQINRIGMDLIHSSATHRRHVNPSHQLGNFLLTNTLDMRLKFDHATQTPPAMVQIALDLFDALEGLPTTDLEPLVAITKDEDRADFLKHWAAGRMAQ